MEVTDGSPYASNAMEASWDCKGNPADNVGFDAPDGDPVDVSYPHAVALDDDTPGGQPAGDVAGGIPNRDPMDAMDKNARDTDPVDTRWPCAGKGAHTGDTVSLGGDDMSRLYTSSDDTDNNTP